MRSVCEDLEIVGALSHEPNAKLWGPVEILEDSVELEFVLERVDICSSAEEVDRNVDVGSRAAREIKKLVD